MTREVLLYSGGLDSAMAWLLLDHPLALYVRLGHQYQRRELEAVAAQELLTTAVEWLGLPRLRVAQVDGPRLLGQLESSDGHIPCRNLALVTAAAALGYDRIYLVATAGETSPDKSRRWARATSRALSVSEGRRIQVVLPFRHLTKGELLRKVATGRYGNLSARLRLLRATWSCYRGMGGACGCCLACFRRWVAWKYAGAVDRTSYRLDPAEQARAIVDGTSPSQGWDYLRRMPLSEWWGAWRLNYQAYRAVREP